MEEAGKESTPIAQERLEKAFEGPAQFVNRVYLTKSPLGVRLSFVEVVPNSLNEHFRSAVYLSPLDAWNLKKLIERQLEGVILEEKPEEAA